MYSCWYFWGWLPLHCAVRLPGAEGSFSGVLPMVLYWCGGSCSGRETGRARGGLELGMGWWRWEGTEGVLGGDLEMRELGAGGKAGGGHWGLGSRASSFGDGDCFNTKSFNTRVHIYGILLL